jgi:hypothetical protein
MSCAMVPASTSSRVAGVGVQCDFSRRTAVDHAIGRDFGITGGDVKEAGTVGRDGEREDAISNVPRRRLRFFDRKPAIPAQFRELPSCKVVKIVGARRFRRRPPRSSVVPDSTSSVQIPARIAISAGSNRFGAKRAAQFLEHDRDIEA